MTKILCCILFDSKYKAILKTRGEIKVGLMLCNTMLKNATLVALFFDSDFDLGASAQVR
jgi:hypothetical protein